MQFAGVLPEDAPDPRLEREQLVKSMPIPIVDFIPQAAVDFAEELGLGLHDWDSPALASERVLRHGVDVVIDGVTLQGAEIDTDPFVYAVGAKLTSGGTLTAIVPREYLPYLTLEFVQRRSG